MKKYLSRLPALLLALLLLIAPASALTVDQALEILEALYYYDIPDEAYEATTVDELMGLLSDPYTEYMSAEEYQAFLDALEGSAGTVGIGVSIRYTEQGILVLDTISGGSAREAGLRAGDLIIEIDGVSCVPADESSADLITGKEGTTVSITVLRDGKTRTYTLTRRPVVIPNTEIQLMDGGIGYIDCNSFGMDTGTDFAQLVGKNDSKVNVWIVDLRGNGGGYVSAAADMLSALMGPGRYVCFESGDGSVRYVSGQQSAASAKPVIVLTDGGSASASEIVVSNIRDLGRGISVGSRTYGKGVAQSMLDEDVLPEYFDGDSLKITVYRYYSAMWNTPDRMGVIPTLLVGNGKAADVALALCGRQGNAKLRIQLNGGTYYVDPDAAQDTLEALLAALPPQAETAWSDNGGRYQTCTAAEAADKLGVAWLSRWFTDVSDSKYAAAINAMGTYDLLQGDGRGHFTPKGNLTRAELCTMLARVLNVAYRGDSLFTDVSQTAWYGPSVNAMAYLGLVDGVDGIGGRFKPNDTLTQEQFLTILGRTARFINWQMDDYGTWLEENEGRLTLSQQMALTPFAGWARSNTAVLAYGLKTAMRKDGDLLFAPLDELSPKAPILREEAAAGMYAVLSGLEILP